MLEDAINSTLHVNLELSRGEVVELLEDTDSGADLLGGPVVHEFGANDLVDGGSVVEVDKESAELDRARGGVLETEVGTLSSVPVDTPVEGGNTLSERISNYIKAERVSVAEVGESTFSGVRSGIDKPLALNIRGVVVKTDLKLWGLRADNSPGSAVDNGLETLDIGASLIIFRLIVLTLTSVLSSYEAAPSCLTTIS